MSSVGAKAVHNQTIQASTGTYTAHHIMSINFEQNEFYLVASIAMEHGSKQIHVTLAIVLGKKKPKMVDQMANSPKKNNNVHFCHFQSFLKY